MDHLSSKTKISELPRAFTENHVLIAHTLFDYSAVRCRRYLNGKNSADFEISSLLEGQRG